jgi:hypothetical protein
MQRRVVALKFTEVSEARTASIIRAAIDQLAPLKRRSTSMTLQGGISQKVVIFILAAEKT